MTFGFFVDGKVGEGEGDNCPGLSGESGEDIVD